MKLAVAALWRVVLKMMSKMLLIRCLPNKIRSLRRMTLTVSPLHQTRITDLPKKKLKISSRTNPKNCPRKISAVSKKQPRKK